MSDQNPNSTALARRTIEPTNMNELRAFAADAAATKFFGAKSQQEALIICVSGHDLGLSYAQSLRAFHVIEGRPALSADGMVAVCLAHPDVCEYFTTVESSSTQATVETKRRGVPTPARLTFTIEDGKRAGLAGRPNWQKYPARMILARAKSWLARDVYPDLLLGLYDPDELANGDAVETSTPWTAPAPASAPPAIDVEAQPVDHRAELRAALAKLPKPVGDDVDAFLVSTGKPTIADPLFDRPEARRKFYEAMSNGLGEQYRQWTLANAERAQAKPKAPAPAAPDATWTSEIECAYAAALADLKNAAGVGILLVDLAAYCLAKKKKPPAQQDVKGRTKLAQAMAVEANRATYDAWLVEVGRAVAPPAREPGDEDDAESDPFTDGADAASPL